MGSRLSGSMAGNHRALVETTLPIQPTNVKHFDIRNVARSRRKFNTGRTVVSINELIIGNSLTTDFWLLTTVLLVFPLPLPYLTAPDVRIGVRC